VVLTLLRHRPAVVQQCQRQAHLHLAHHESSACCMGLYRRVIS
jgi:hypothetical protein